MSENKRKHEKIKAISKVRSIRWYFKWLFPHAKRGGVFSKIDVVEVINANDMQVPIFAYRIHPDEKYIDVPEAYIGHINSLVKADITKSEEDMHNLIAAYLIYVLNLYAPPTPVFTEDYYIDCEVSKPILNKYFLPNISVNFEHRFTPNHEQKCYNFEIDKLEIFCFGEEVAGEVIDRIIDFITAEAPLFINSKAQLELFIKVVAISIICDEVEYNYVEEESDSSSDEESSDEDMERADREE
jgi:hypothetical protein